MKKKKIVNCTSLKSYCPGQSQTQMSSGRDKHQEKKRTSYPLINKAKNCDFSVKKIMELFNHKNYLCFGNIGKIQIFRIY